MNLTFCVVGTPFSKDQGSKIVPPVFDKTHFSPPTFKQTKNSLLTHTIFYYFFLS